MTNRSAGILLYRRTSGGGIEVLIAHPGGPLWARKDLGAWSIPKGLVDAGESAWDAARREFAEEIGSAAVFLATNGYVTGQQINVSGGFGI